jgi:hypothetical protein
MAVDRLARNLVIVSFLMAANSMLVACDDDEPATESDADVAGDADVADAVDDDGPVEHPVAYTIRFVNTAEERIGGVEVCWYQDDSVPCQTSESPDGTATLALPADTAGAIQVTHKTTILSFSSTRRARSTSKRLGPFYC